MRLFKSFLGNIIKTIGTITLLIILFIIFATLGYQAANQETKVATIKIYPQQPQQFKAVIKWINGTTKEYQIHGDEFYIDAKVLKWKGWVSFMGVKTWYEFDRIGGRYVNIDDEKTKPRSLYQLAAQKDFDLYYVRKQYPMLSVLVDAEYGSAAFFLANMTKTIDLFVARSGLTIRVRNGDQPPSLTVQ